jgi:class 3 adenylate cyclase/tetratricopeptide (TPR) repeat protein
VDAVEERKLATIVFADLVGSTELGASQDPERTRALLERFYDAMAAEVEGAGGTVETFAGDAVMAVFGAPTAHEDDAERALHTALAMQRRLGELFDDALAVRIGVNTGEVVVGRAREGTSFVTGDAVNVAARLEQGAAPGDILVGERTVVAARGAFEFDAPTRIDAKGKPEGIPARRLLRALSLMRPRGVPGLRAAFVGRAEELGALQEAYRQAVEQAQPRLLTIVGDPGIGKTRLVREFWQWLAEQSPEPLRRTGRSLSYGQATTYWALGEVLREHLGLAENDPPEAILRRLGARSILGLTLGLDTAGDLHPLAARDRLHAAWVEFAQGLVREKPAVLFIEDIHWVEAPLLDLLERLAEDVRGPLLILTTARPELLEARPGWGGRRAAATLVELEPLSADESSRLLDDLLAADLPQPLRSTLVRKAEGNPFFVEELVGTLVDRGILSREDGRWRARALPPGFDVPDTIRSVLAARIDLLGPAEKAALQAATVIGRVFWSGPLYELVPGLEPNLRVLEERDFIRRRSGSWMPGEQEYVIKHALTVEVAYESLPRAARARLHAAFADWLERTDEPVEQHAPLIAHHLAEAVRPEDADLAWSDDDAALARLKTRAVSWLRRAADLAIGRYELDEALAMLERSLALETSDPARAEIWRCVGRANALRYDGEAFWKAMENSLRVCHDRQRCADSYSELAFQTSIRSSMWTRRPDPTLVEGWIAHALEMSDEASAARAKALMARANIHSDESDKAAREATDLADRLGAPELRSWAWAARASVAFHAGRYDEALMWAQRRFELSETITDPDHLVEMREAALPAVGALGRLGEARRLAREHVELSQRLSPHHRMHGIALLAESEELAGAWDAIGRLEETIEKTVEDNRRTPCVRNARCLLLCALARTHRGDEAGARAFEEAADALGMEGHSLALDNVRVRIALARDDIDEVARLVAPGPTFRVVFGVPTLTARLDALAALGDRERVEREAPQFLDSRTYFEPFARRALGIVHDDPTLLEQAVTSFQTLELDWHAETTKALLRRGNVSKR